MFLVERVVTDECSMGEVCPAGCTIPPLDRQIPLPLLADSHCTPHCSLEQAHRRLVQIDEQSLLPGRHPADQMIQPLPTRENLAGGSIPGTKCLQKAGPTPPKSDPKMVSHCDPKMSSYFAPLYIFLYVQAPGDAKKATSIIDGHQVTSGSWPLGPP